MERDRDGRGSRHWLQVGSLRWDRSIRALGTIVLGGMISSGQIMQEITSEEGDCAENWGFFFKSQLVVFL